MEIFSFQSEQPAKISLTLTSAPGFPKKTSIEGGYDLICTLVIEVGCYSVRCTEYFTATGALYRFADQLKACYETLNGKADYSLIYEDDLRFTVTMKPGGHAVISGSFRENPAAENALTFEIPTDQYAFPAVIAGIEGLKERYGDMQGVK